MTTSDTIRAYAQALGAAQAAGAPNPAACADRYLQGLVLGEARRASAANLAAPAMPEVGDIATVNVDGQCITGRVYHLRENGWPCVQSDAGRIASGPLVGAKR